MIIVEKTIENLTPEEYRECYSLNLRQSGKMRCHLRFLRTGNFLEFNCSSRNCTEAMQPVELAGLRESKYSLAYMLRNEHKILAWALVYDYPKGHSVWHSKPGVNAYYYTRKTERRKGYGEMLYATVNDDFPNQHVFPWDDKSEVFFDKMKGK